MTSQESASRTEESANRVQNPAQARPAAFRIRSFQANDDPGLKLVIYTEIG